jgi:hypothetical protein
MPIFAAIPAIAGGIASAAPAISGLVGAGTGIAGAITGGNTAAKTQGQVNGLYQPYQQAGAQALNQINELLSPGHDVMPVLQSMPGYQAGLDEGLTGLMRAENAAGTLNSGGTQKAAIRYGQNYATSTYQNILNNLYKVAGLGEASLAPMADNYASGNASANAAVNQGIGALAGGINSFLNPAQPAAKVPTTPFAPATSFPSIPANSPTIGPLSGAASLPVF